MPWGSVRGHKAQVEQIKKAWTEGRFPHAFLFVGPEGVGKSLFAKTLAQTLLCDTNAQEPFAPCGHCPSCLQIAAGAHPDVLTVAKPEDKAELPIRLIRDLCLDLGLKPMRGTRRIAIVDDADQLNEEASNAFLKTLEEPPPGSVLILIGTSAETQLDTIVSRCRVVRFEPILEADLEAILTDSGFVSDAELAQRLARLGDGSVSRALGLADETLEPFRRAMLDELSQPDTFDPPTLAQRLTAFCEEAGKEASAKRVRARLLIGEMARLFRGVLWQTAGLEPPSPDPDDRRAVITLAAKMEPESVFLLAERCFEADFQITRNANRPLVFASLMHDLGAVIQRTET